MSIGASVVQDHAHAHVVGVYDRDDDLISTVTTFLIEALRHGGAVVVIATPAHRAALDAELASEGFPVGALERTGRYSAFDAKATLETFMRNGRPDREEFGSVIGSIVQAASAMGGPVRLFGEMVGMLWDEGNIEGAIELETMWNDLAENQTFALFCAYAMSSLEASGDLGAAKEMCDQHSDVFSLPSGSAAPISTDAANISSFERIFVGAPAELREVRSFVRDVLRAWGDDQQLVDAEIIASELATNAVKHAHSPFRVSVSRTASSMTLAVRDTSFDRPVPQAAHTGDGGGRGLALVSELSSDWGTRVEPDGKTVWAEVARTAPAA